jgi:hypothetical protein
MADPVNWLLVTTTSAVTLLVPVVTHVVTGRKAKNVRLLGQLRDLSEVIKNLPEGTEARDTLSSHADLLASSYTTISSDRLSIKRDPAGIALGVALAVVGANLGVYMLVQGGTSLWWLVLFAPLFAIGLFGATYEVAGGKSRRPQRGIT